jgi:hypothetical protein
MSRNWLNQPDNLAMKGWELEADDLYAGVMVVDLATPAHRMALSGDFETCVPIIDAAQLGSLRALGD